MLSIENQKMKDEIFNLKPLNYGNILYLKYKGFAEHENEPMIIRRAHAFSSLLTDYPKTFHQNDILAGTMSGIKTIEDADFKNKVMYVRNIGDRTFATNGDHAAPNFEKLLSLGIGGLIKKTEDAMEKYAYDEQKTVFLQSVIISLNAFSNFLKDYAKNADKKMANTLLSISHEPPKTFQAALLLVWMVMHVFFLEGRSAMAFGRLDQYLYPFYKKDKENNLLNDEECLAMFENVFLKIGEKRPLFGGDDVCNICIGGVDEKGEDGTNELSYIILEAVKNCQIPGPNLTARVHKNTKDEFYKKCIECLKTGCGYPAIINDEINIPMLLKRGYSLVDARNYCFVGCIENFLQGKQPPWTDGRLDAAKYLELVLTRGKCMLTGEQIGVDTGEPRKFATFEDFMEAYKCQANYGVKKHMEVFYQYNSVSDPENYTSPFLSALFDDCIERGMDINMGGTVYSSNYGVGLMGIATVADSLCAVKTLVFDKKKFDMDTLINAISANYKGYKWVHELVSSAPKYGNDNDEVDRYAVWFVDYFHEAFNQYRTKDNGFVWIAVAGNINNIFSGKCLAATPDGRFAQTPLSDAASPSYGADKTSATAVMNSVTKVNFEKSETGSVLNQKYHPDLLEDENNLSNMVALIKTYFEKGGQELQINVVDKELLLDAMENPHKHQNLMIRVSGFSAKFVDLDSDVQKDIIARTEHGIEPLTSEKIS